MRFLTSLAPLWTALFVSTVALGHGNHNEDNDGLDITHLSCVGNCCAAEKHNPMALVQLALYAVNEKFPKPKEELLNCVQACDDTYGENSFHAIQKSFSYMSKHALSSAWGFVEKIDDRVEDAWHGFLKRVGIGPKQAPLPPAVNSTPETPAVPPIFTDASGEERSSQPIDHHGGVTSEGGAPGGLPMTNESGIVEGGGEAVNTTAVSEGVPSADTTEYLPSEACPNCSTEKGESVSKE